MKNEAQSDWQRVDAMTDAEIDTSDIPPLGDEFSRKASVRKPPHRVTNVEAAPESLRELFRDRHTLDAIARAIVSGERGLGEIADRIADDFASIMINRLEANGVPGYSRVAHLPRNAPERWARIEREYGREVRDLIIRRTDKHLAHAAMLACTRGDRST